MMTTKVEGHRHLWPLDGKILIGNGLQILWIVLVCHSCVALEYNMACLIVCFRLRPVPFTWQSEFTRRFGDIVVTAGQLALECQVPAAKTARGAKSGQTLWKCMAGTVTFVLIALSLIDMWRVFQHCFIAVRVEFHGSTTHTFNPA